MTHDHHTKGFSSMFTQPQYTFVVKRGQRTLAKSEDLTEVVKAQLIQPGHTKLVAYRTGFGRREQVVPFTWIEEVLWDLCGDIIGKAGAAMYKDPELLSYTALRDAGLTNLSGVQVTRLMVLANREAAQLKEDAIVEQAAQMLAADAGTNTADALIAAGLTDATNRQLVELAGRANTRAKEIRETIPVETLTEVYENDYVNPAEDAFNADIAYTVSVFVDGALEADYCFSYNHVDDAVSEYERQVNKAKASDELAQTVVTLYDNFLNMNASRWDGEAYADLMQRGISPEAVSNVTNAMMNNVFKELLGKPVTHLNEDGTYSHTF